MQLLYVPFKLRGKSIFLAERLLVCMDCHLNVHVSARWQISSHMHSLQDEVEVGNDHNEMQRGLSGSTSKECEVVIPHSIHI